MIKWWIQEVACSWFDTWPYNEKKEKREMTESALYRAHPFTFTSNRSLLHTFDTSCDFVSYRLPLTFNMSLVTWTMVRYVCVCVLFSLLPPCGTVNEPTIKWDNVRKINNWIRILWIGHTVLCHGKRYWIKKAIESPKNSIDENQ